MKDDDLREEYLPPEKVHKRDIIDYLVRSARRRPAEAVAFAKK